MTERTAEEKAAEEKKVKDERRAYLKTRILMLETKIKDSKDALEALDK